MPIKKKKISELTLADSLTGLYTIGVKLINGVQTSVKVSLGTIQTAYENMLKVTQEAITATKNAITATSNANTATSNANKATENADRATTNANEATRLSEIATNNANTATNKANKAADNADAARVGLDKIKQDAVTATSNANTATEDANKATEDANKATQNANTQAGRAKQHADNPPKMGENGNWYKWNEAKQAYEDTGILAKGGVLYPVFSIKPETMELEMYYQDEVAADMFAIDENGNLTFNPK